MTDISDNYVEPALFPVEDFQAVDIVPPPDVWIDAQRVHIVAGDAVSTATYVIPSYVDQPRVTLLVPRRGNNERKRVMITTSGFAVTLFAGPDDGAIPVSSGGVTHFPGGFMLATGVVFSYESAAPLWVVGMGATTEHSIVSVLAESYYRNK